MVYHPSVQQNHESIVWSGSNYILSGEMTLGGKVRTIIDEKRRKDVPFAAAKRSA